MRHLDSFEDDDDRRRNSRQTIGWVAVILVVALLFGSAYYLSDRRNAIVSSAGVTPLVSASVRLISNPVVTKSDTVELKEQQLIDRVMSSQPEARLTASSSRLAAIKPEPRSAQASVSRSTVNPGASPPAAVSGFALPKGQNPFGGTTEFPLGLPKLPAVVARNSYGNETLPGPAPQWDVYTVPFRGIPEKIHQTVKNKKGQDAAVVRTENSWKQLNPSHKYYLYDDTDMKNYVKYNAPQYLDVYDKLLPVERADFWRYLVIYIDGGVYSDADTICLEPVVDWNSDNRNDANVLLGVENHCKSEDDRRRNEFTYTVQILQWTFASVANHPLFLHTLDYIARQVRTGVFRSPKGEPHDRTMETLYRTGPGVFTAAVSDYLAFFNKRLVDIVDGGVVGDIRFFPWYTFNALNAENAWQYPKLVAHLFRGSWKLPPPSSKKESGLSKSDFFPDAKKTPTIKIIEEDLPDDDDMDAAVIQHLLPQSTMAKLSAAKAKAKQPTSKLRSRRHKL